MNQPVLLPRTLTALTVGPLRDSAAAVCAYCVIGTLFVPTLGQLATLIIATCSAASLVLVAGVSSRWWALSAWLRKKLKARSSVVYWSVWWVLLLVVAVCSGLPAASDWWAWACCVMCFGATLVVRRTTSSTQMLCRMGLVVAFAGCVVASVNEVLSAAQSPSVHTSLLIVAFPVVAWHIHSWVLAPMRHVGFFVLAVGAVCLALLAPHAVIVAVVLAAVWFAGGATWRQVSHIMVAVAAPIVLSVSFLRWLSPEWFRVHAVGHVRALTALSDSPWGQRHNAQSMVRLESFSDLMMAWGLPGLAAAGSVVVFGMLKLRSAHRTNGPLWLTWLAGYVVCVVGLPVVHSSFVVVCGVVLALTCGPTTQDPVIDTNSQQPLLDQVQAVRHRNLGPVQVHTKHRELQQLARSGQRPEFAPEPAGNLLTLPVADDLHDLIGQPPQPEPSR